MSEIFNQFELHYFFSDTSHGFDAKVRNECEKELLNLFEEVCSDLEVKVLIEAKPPQNGGFIEVWEFIGMNKEMITLIVSVLTLIMSRVPVQNKKLTRLQIENLEIDNKIKKEELKRLGIDPQKLDPTIVQKIIDFLIKSYRIIWRRSNFFKKITLYKRVNRIEINKLNNYVPSKNPISLNLGDFEQFILFDENLPDVTGQIENVDLISSALKPGKFRWKAFLNSQIIDFEMLDENFKKHVFEGHIPHNNKVRLKIELNHSRKIDDSGQIKISKYYVTKVLSYSINGITYNC